MGKSCVKHCMPATGYSGSVDQGRGGEGRGGGGGGARCKGLDLDAR